MPESHSRSASSALRNGLFNTAAVYVYPLRNVSLNLQWELGRVEISRGQYVENHFLDASLRWTVLKRVELSASISNLLNRDTYEEARFDGLNYHYYSTPLRGREALFSCSVKF